METLAERRARWIATAADAFDMLEALRAAQAEPVGPEFVTLDTLPPGVEKRPTADAIRRGELPASKCGRRWTVRMVDLRAWIASRQPTPANSDGYMRSLAIVRGQKR